MTPILIYNCPYRQQKRATLRLITARGFTLLEILMVLSIMAMVSLVVVPNITGLESRTFSAQVREAHSLLNYARRIAVVSGQPSTASFYMSNPDADEAETSSLARSSIGRWSSEGAAVTFRDSTDRDIEIEEKVEITFYPEGGSTGGNLLLSFEERVASLKVDPFTGRIKLEYLDEL